MKTVNPSTPLEGYGKRNRTIKFYTLGCKVNQYDTQNMRERFVQAGFTELEDSQPANVYVINTCTVTHRADCESLNLIRRAKRESSQAKIIVTGCLTELDEDKIKKQGSVSLIVKNKDKGHIVNRLSRHDQIDQHDELTGTTNYGISYFKGHTRAFLKIQDGCNNLCSYCKVPKVRGPSRSKPLKQIIYEAGRLVKNGFKEIVLSGICLGAYGQDLKPMINLVDVIEELEKIAGLLRIRLSSIEAGDISDELIDKMTGAKKLCQHLHIPLQSGDDAILKKMKRNYSYEDYLGIILKIKKIIPKIAITTDVLVGFPGETEYNFQNTLKLIKEILPLKVHIFPYSPRNTTAASNFKDVLNPIIIKERISRLKDISFDCGLVYKVEFLNKKIDVLIEGRLKEDEKYWEGYTENYIKVWVKSAINLKNKLIPLQLKKISEDISYGVLC